MEKKYLVLAMKKRALLGKQGQAKESSGVAPGAKKVLLAALGVAAMAALAYSLYAALSSGADKQGLVVCPEEGKCFWTAHYHAFVHAEVCGEERRLPIEKGSLQRLHTHEEKNVLHWHDKLPYDKQSGNLTDATPLLLRETFGQLEIEFGKGSFWGRKDGDSCADGRQGSLKFFVNGQPNADYGEYAWRDRDVLVVVFDGRTELEVGEWLEKNPVQFPSLGKG